MDDKDGSVCNEGPYPVLNTIKRELQVMTSTKPSITKSTTMYLPFGFWSRRRTSSAPCQSVVINRISSIVLNIILYFIII